MTYKAVLFDAYGTTLDVDWPPPHLPLQADFPH